LWSSGSITPQISKIIQYLFFTTWLSNANWSIYVVVLYIFIFLIFFLFGSGIAFQTFPREIFLNSSFTSLIRILLQLIGTILFIPIVDYLFSILLCQNLTPGSASTHILFPQDECWTSFHFVHSIFAMISLVIFLTIATFNALFFHQYKTNSSSPDNMYFKSHSFLL
jgi:hypothetical protein